MMIQLQRWLQSIATYDVLPDFSAHVRRLLRSPLGVLLLAAAVACLCGFFLHPQGFVLGGGLAAIIVLGVIWPWLSLRWTSGFMAFDRRKAVEGESVQLQVTLRNRFVFAALGLVVRQGFGRGDDEDAFGSAVASVASVPALRSCRCVWAFVPACRGVYPASAPRMATGFPFGLWETSRAMDVATILIVWPRTYPVGPAPLVGGDQQVDGNVSRNKVGTSGDVVGVRPYRRGDSPRRIHWSQSAKHDRLIVCELQSNARPVIQLVLDVDMAVHDGVGPDSSREWAIRIVASLAKGWLEAGAQVGGVWNGEVMAPSAGQPQVHRMLDSLARLPAASTHGLAETLALPACRGFHDGLQLIVTTDTAVGQMRHSFDHAEAQKWLILKASAFGDARRGIHPPLTPCPSPRIKPWVWIDDIGQIPRKLLCGWEEARHGS